MFQMAYKFIYNLCLECNEEIFNPICPPCIAKSMKSWIKNKINKNTKIGKVNKYRDTKLIRLYHYINKIIKQQNQFTNNATICICCNRASVYLCPYCFTEAIYNKMKQMKIKKQLLAEFIYLFNFDVEHTGYSKDFEELGLY